MGVDVFINNMNLVTISVLSLALFGSFTTSAGIFMNGGGYSADLDNVWFTGSKPVEYCIRVAPDFAHSPEALRAVVEESLGDWRAFFRKHQLDTMQFNDRSQQRPPEGLSLDFRWVSKCHPHSTQLELLFGVQTDEVKLVLATHPRLLGFTYRNHYDFQNWQTKGSIYFDKWLTNPKHLKHFIVHELGHVFGMAHDRLPIMIEHLADSFIRGSPREFAHSSIESDTWRYRLLPEDEIVYSQGDASNRLLPDGLFGFAINGTHSLKLRVYDSANGFRHLQLIAKETETGKTAVMSGKFVVHNFRESRWEGYAGPVMFGLWRKPDCNSALSVRRSLDHRPPNLEAEGTFSFNDQNFPALMQANPAVEVRLFLPNGTWWSVKPYPSVKAWTNL